jgi:putative membrane protein
MHFGPMEFVLVLMIIGIPVGLVWIVFQWIRYFTRGKGSANALDIAKERYARGEITKAEFEDIKNTVSKAG